MAKQAIITLFLILISTSAFSQNLNVESNTEHLGDYKYKFTYTFSESVVFSGNFEDEFPFPYLITSPREKITIDSVNVFGNETMCEVYLTLRPENKYVLLAVNITSKDGEALGNPIVHNFDTFSDQDEVKLEGKLGWGIPTSLTVPYEDYLLYPFVFTSKKIFDNNYYDVDLSEHQNILSSSDIISFDTTATRYNSVTFSNPISEDNIEMSVPKDSSFYIYSCTLLMNAQNSDEGVLTIVPYRYEEIQSYTAVKDSTGIDFSTDVYLVSNEKNHSLSVDYRLLNAYPNPFNPSTQIQYTLPEAGSITISVFNVLGQQVRTLAEGTRSSGNHTITFNATGLPAGMYVVRLESTGQSGKVFAETKKVMLLK